MFEKHLFVYADRFQGFQKGGHSIYDTWFRREQPVGRTKCAETEDYKLPLKIV